MSESENYPSVEEKEWKIFERRLEQCKKVPEEYNDCDQARADLAKKIIISAINSIENFPNGITYNQYVQILQYTAESKENAEKFMRSIVTATINDLYDYIDSIK